MFEKWRIVQITKNTEGGEAQECVAYDTEQLAWNQFWYRCDKVGTNPATSILEIMVLDNNGGVVRKEIIDNRKYATE